MTPEVCAAKRPTRTAFNLNFDLVHKLPNSPEKSDTSAPPHRRFTYSLDFGGNNTNQRLFEQGELRGIHFQHVAATPASLGHFSHHIHLNGLCGTDLRLAYPRLTGSIGGVRRRQHDTSAQHQGNSAIDVSD
jgi:hypothetical protein